MVLTQKASCTNPRIGTLFLSYFLGIVTDTERKEFEDHLLRCSYCCTEMVAAGKTICGLQESRLSIIQRLQTAEQDFETLLNLLSKF